MPLVLVGLLGLGACSNSSTPRATQRVVHLDPRLPDFRSPSVVLSGATTSIREWTFEEGAGLPPEWQLVGTLEAGIARFGGLVLGPGKGVSHSAALAYTGSVDPAQVNAVEVRAVVAHSARAMVGWQLPGASLPGSCSSLAAESPEPQVLRFSLSALESWMGESALAGLILRPSENHTQSLELLSIRFLHEGFALGASPLDPAPASALAATSGDGGLVTVGGEAYRAWPMDLDQRLEATTDVPKGGRLSLRLAAPSGADTAGLSLVVTAEDLDAGGASIQLLDQSVAAGSWGRVSLDLGALAGKSVRLGFQARAAVPSSTPRARLLLGAPLVLGELAKDRRPNLVLVTLDTTRFDALGPSRGPAAANGETAADKLFLVHTPFLDAFAANSFVFDNAWSAANSTQPSHASILTGLAGQDHSLNDNFGVLSAATVTLAERLRDAGYQTAAVTCQRAIGPDAGFGQGFDQFVPAEAVSGTDGRLAVDAARRWLDEWRAEGDRPFFLWVHVFDPHTPYELPKGFLDTFAKSVGTPVPPKNIVPPTLPRVKVMPPELAFLAGVDNEALVDYLYHVEVAYTDSLMESLFQGLAPTAPNTLAILTADHGEFLGERNNYYNHRGLFPETLHVPLFVRLPGQSEGQRVPDRVTSRDIVPTVIGALGLGDIPAARDLLAVARSGADASRRFWFEHANGLAVGCRDEQYHFFTVLRDGYTFGMRTRSSPAGPVVEPAPIPKGSVFLYDWTKDPGLTHSLAAEQPELAAHYLALLAEYRASARPVGHEARAVSAAEEAALEDLGYTGD